MTGHHLVLITIDSLRGDALGSSGAEGVATPHLDALARTGVHFSQAITPGPRTPSAFPAILASLYSLAAGDRKGLPSNAVTWAETMRAAGYRTAGFNPSNPFLTSRTGYNLGFDLFVDFWDLHEPGEVGRRPGVIASAKKKVQDSLGRRNLGLLMLLQATFARGSGQYLTGDMITDRALDWIRQQHKPTFTWLHFMDVHYPYLPVEEGRRWIDRLSYLIGMASMSVGRFEGAVKTLRRLYDRRVELVDRHIGAFVENLKECGLAEQAVVVVTSDHGERFYEHGEFAHGPDMYDESLRVPLIVSAPGLLEPRAVDTQVSLIDLAPTMLELLGLPVPNSFQGESFLPLLRGEPYAGPPSVFIEAMHSGQRRSWVGLEDVYRIVACRGEGWKYIYDEQGPLEELYHLHRDPHERENLIGQTPQALVELRRQVADHGRFVVEQAALYEHAEDRGLGPEDAELRRRLAALGYL